MSMTCVALVASQALIGFHEAYAHEPARIERGRVKRGAVIATVRVMPLQLSWAATVLRVQGIGLDQLHADFAGAWAVGQKYTVLSRVRTLAGLTLAAVPARIHSDAKVSGGWGGIAILGSLVRDSSSCCS